jgi:hypothetical protein
MRKLISLLFASTALTAFASACAVEAPTAEELGSMEEASCTNTEGTNAMIAGLAVAIGRELQRWKVGTDFKVVTGYNNQQVLELTPTGLAQCQNGCLTVKALLAFQDSRNDQKLVFPGGQKLSSWSYASRLVAGYREQLTCEARPSNNTTNANNCPAEEHKLSLAGITPGACDLNYTFNARTPAGGMLVAPSLLRNRLLWTGGTANPYVAFTSTNSTVTIDPTFGLNGDTDPSQSGSCTAACSKTSTTRAITGQCCQNPTTKASGKFLAPDPKQPHTYRCSATGC